MKSWLGSNCAHECAESCAVVRVYLHSGSAVATKGPCPLTTACAPTFRFTQTTFLEHYVTTRQQNRQLDGSLLRINLSERPTHVEQ